MRPHEEKHYFTKLGSSAEASDQKPTIYVNRIRKTSLYQKDFLPAGYEEPKGLLTNNVGVDIYSPSGLALSKKK